MDYKLLFHNPEELSDLELKLLRQKIQLQRSLPYYTAGIFGFASYLFDSAILKKKYSWTRIGAFGFVGFVIGAHATYHVHTTFPLNR